MRLNIGVINTGAANVIFLRWTQISPLPERSPIHRAQEQFGSMTIPFGRYVLMRPFGGSAHGSQICLPRESLMGWERPDGTQVRMHTGKGRENTPHDIQIINEQTPHARSEQF
jgi:hypothetical protein